MANYKIESSSKFNHSHAITSNFNKYSSNQMITNYIGLSNQGIYLTLNSKGNTCYLNSLLQCLFMTPEFRMDLFKWEYSQENHGALIDCIPYQLQKLFARLQLKFRNIEDTKNLTKSIFYMHIN